MTQAHWRVKRRRSDTFVVWKRVLFAGGSSEEDVGSSWWNFGRFLLFEGRVRAGFLRSSPLRMLKSLSPSSLLSKRCTWKGILHKGDG
jgi:hypothetical protein